MSKNCPNCGFELKDLDTKKIEVEIRKEFEEKEELFKETIKSKLKIEFSSKELEHKKNEIQLKGKIQTLQQDKKANIELSVAAELQKQKSELTAEFQIEKTENNNENIRLQNLIDELKKKSNQGSQQAQGEAGEILIENTLKSEFPQDIIKEVPKGVNGADISHYVRDNIEREIGIIYIEVKNAKKFSPSWISKLKEDMKNKNANYSILVTLDIPENTKNYEDDDLFICGFHDYLLAVKLLRGQLLEIEKTKILEINRNDKSALIYDYVTGREFAQWVRGMMDYMKEQKDNLEKDMRHHTKSIETRRKQIEKMETSHLTLIGHFRGLGASEDFAILEDMTGEE